VKRPIKTAYDFYLESLELLIMDLSSQLPAKHPFLEIMNNLPASDQVTGQSNVPEAMTVQNIRRKRLEQLAKINEIKRIEDIVNRRIDMERLYNERRTIAGILHAGRERRDGRLTDAAKLTQLDFDMVRYLQNGAEDALEMLFSTLAELDAIGRELHRKAQEAAREQN
jgi:hypothetical protein